MDETGIGCVNEGFHEEKIDDGLGVLAENAVDAGSLWNHPPKHIISY